MKIRAEYTCPLELVHDILKGKWKMIILWRLRVGNTSLSKLKNDINGITEKMLLQHLKDLIDHSFISKKEYNGYPLKVEYYLTTRGIDVIKALRIFQQIGIDYMNENDEIYNINKIELK